MTWLIALLAPLLLFRHGKLRRSSSRSGPDSEVSDSSKFTSVRSGKPAVLLDE